MDVKILTNTNRPALEMAGSAIEITKNDTTTFSAGCLYVGTGGIVKVDMADGGTAVTFAGVPDGTFMPIYVTRVYAATTTASDFVICY
jgi:hypothetical protein